jgi:phenylacetate-CoA ligase
VTRELIELSQMWPRLRWSRERMLGYRDARLRRVVAHAYAGVPYYRALFDRAGVRPSDIRSAHDLGAIPITSKRDVQQLPEEHRLAAAAPRRALIRRQTGGSTGQPTVIRRTWLEERLLSAFRLRARVNLGLRLTDRVASVGSVRPKQASDRQLPALLLQQLGFFRQVRVDCKRPVDEVIRALAQARPDVITGYAGAVARVAQSLLERGSDPLRRAIRPRFVTTGAEVQTPLMRQQIGEAFGCPVYNVYGAHEVNLVAWECPQTGALHTCDDLVLVEVLRPDGSPAAPGKRGEVVITSLQSYAMPFIRYRLDDLVTRGGEVCGCGLPFGTIHNVLGRMIDYFPLPDGRAIHPNEIIGGILHDRAAWARQVQLVQERRDLVVLRLVPFQMPGEQRLAEIRRQAARLLGERVQFRIDFVPELDLEPSGKFRVARSMVRSNYDGAPHAS